MGHHINAIIGKLPVNEDKIGHYGLATAFEDGFAIILLDEDHIFQWIKISGLDAVNDIDEEVYEGELIHFFAKEIGFSRYAVIKTDYFAGIGEQHAILFDNSKIEMRGSINQVLGSLGVVVKDKCDEFEQIALDYYRTTEYYYWQSEKNWARLKPNMIPGRMPEAK